MYVIWPSIIYSGLPSMHIFDEVGRHILNFMKSNFDDVSSSCYRRAAKLIMCGSTSWQIPCLSNLLWLQMIPVHPGVHSHRSLLSLHAPLTQSSQLRLQSSPKEPLRHTEKQGQLKFSCVFKKKNKRTSIIFSLRLFNLPMLLSSLSSPRRSLWFSDSSPPLLPWLPSPSLL